MRGLKQKPTTRKHYKIPIPICRCIIRSHRLRSRVLWITLGDLRTITFRFIPLPHHLFP